MAPDIPRVRRFCMSCCAMLTFDMTLGEHAKVFFPPLPTLIVSSLIISLLWYIVGFRAGTPLLLFASVALFGQLHFLMAYTFGFRSVARWLKGTAPALALYGLLIFGTIYFYDLLFVFVFSFWGQMALWIYFLLHHTENMLFFWETLTTKSAPIFSRWGRRIFYTLLSAIPFVVLFSKARTDAGLPKPDSIWIFFAYVILGIGIAGFLLIQSMSMQKRGVLALVVLTTAALSFALQYSGLTFLFITLFIILWHFVIWHIFYIQKTWRKNDSHPSFYSGELPTAWYLRFVRYPTSGTGPFLATTLLFLAPILTYFFITFDGAATTLITNPFYGEYALFIWSIPHITFSFLPTPKG